MGKHDGRVKVFPLEHAGDAKAERYMTMIEEMARLQALYDPFSMNFDPQEDPMADAVLDPPPAKTSKAMRWGKRQK